MQDSHKKQIDDGRRKTLMAAGIGRVYHEKSLQGVDGGHWVVGWLKDNFRDVLTGTGLIFRGDTPDVRDRFILTARALHVSSINVLHTPLSRLSSWLSDPDVFDDIAQKDVLFISRFIEENECPLREFERARVEDLLDTRADSARATFVWNTVPAHTKAPAWWSNATMNRLSDLNEVAP